MYEFLILGISQDFNIFRHLFVILLDFQTFLIFIYYHFKYSFSILLNLIYAFIRLVSYYSHFIKTFIP